MVAGFSRAVGVDRTAVHEAWRILFRRRGALCRAKAFPVSSQAFGHVDLSATAPCRASASCADNLPVVIPRLDALRAGDDAVHTAEGKKVRLLIVAACRKLACVALHYASVKFGQSRELVHRHMLVGSE